MAEALLTRRGGGGKLQVVRGTDVVVRDGKLVVEGLGFRPLLVLTSGWWDISDWAEIHGTDVTIEIDKNIMPDNVVYHRDSREGNHPFVANINTIGNSNSFYGDPYSQDVDMDYATRTINDNITDDGFIYKSNYTGGKANGTIISLQTSEILDQGTGQSLWVAIGIK